MDLAGLDHRRYVYTTDPVERLLELAIGEQVAVRREEHNERERRNLAVEIGNNIIRANGGR